MKGRQEGYRSYNISETNLQDILSDTLIYRATDLLPSQPMLGLQLWEAMCQALEAIGAGRRDSLPLRLDAAPTL